MYQVVAVLQGNEHVLMDIRDEEYILEVPRLTLQINNAGMFTFNIHPTHPEAKSIIPLVTLVKVYKTDYRTYKKWMFTGRVIDVEKDIYNNLKVKCEGILAYLVDSIVYPYEYQGTPADYIKQLINSHNSQVNQEKQFTLRVLDLSDIDTNNNIVRANRNYPTTMQEIMLMYGKEASNRKQEIDRQHHTIPNKRTKDQKTNTVEMCITCYSVMEKSVHRTWKS